MKTFAVICIIFSYAMMIRVAYVNAKRYNHKIQYVPVHDIIDMKE